MTKSKRPTRRQKVRKTAAPSRSTKPWSLAKWAVALAALSAALALISVILTVVWFGHDVILKWWREPNHELVLVALSSGAAEEIPGIGRGIKVSFVLNNFTKPQAKVHNVAGQLWTQDSHLLATLKDPSVTYQERRSTGRVEHDLWFPVLPKTASARLPTWVYREPNPGEEIQFGAQIVSTDTDKHQYRWMISNRDGKSKFSIVESPHDYK
jgi:hypothetical protein